MTENRKQRRVRVRAEKKLLQKNPVLAAEAEEYNALLATMDRALNFRNALKQWRDEQQTLLSLLELTPAANRDEDFEEFFEGVQETIAGAEQKLIDAQATLCSLNEDFIAFIDPTRLVKVVKSVIET